MFMSPARIVCILNMKGGVGKTTLAVNIAYVAARFRNKKILLIDIDPQFNATQYLMDQKKYVEHLTDPTKLNTLDIFKPRNEHAPSTVSKSGLDKKAPKMTLDNIVVHIYSDGGKLDLIPSTLQLMEIQDARRGTEYRLAHFVSTIKDAYDYILIDCPPTLSMFTLSAYLASDVLLVPMQPDYLSTIGLPLLERAIEQYDTDYGHKIHDMRIVFTMVDIRTNLMKERMKEIRKSRNTLNNYLRRSISVAEAVGKNKPLFDFDKSKEYGEEIIKITDELLQSIGET